MQSSVDTGENHRRSQWALLVAILAISSSAILVRMTVTPPLITAFYRQFFCAILILPFAGSEPAPALNGRQRWLLIVSGFFLAVHFATWISSLFLTTVARANLFVDLQPVWASMLGALFLKERLSSREIAAVAIVCAGGLIIVTHAGSKGSTSWIGDLLAITGGIAGAAYLVVGRRMRSSIPWARYMLAVYGISASWLLVINIVLTGRLPVPAERDLIWLALMAIGPGILGHGLLNVAVRNLKVYTVNAALMAEPVIATFLAYLLFAEAPNSYYYAGAALIFAGLFQIFRESARFVAPPESSQSNHIM